MTDQPRVLRVNVAALGDDRRVHLWRRGQTPPPQVAATLGEHVWEGSEVVLDRRAARREALAAARIQETAGALNLPPVNLAPVGADTPATGDPAGPQPTYVVGETGPDLVPPAPVEASEEPPRTGPGASADAWREYARTLGQDVGAKAPRDAVIAQLADAGLIDP